MVQPGHEARVYQTPDPAAVLTLHRYLLRPLLVFLTLAMLVAALFQVAGRLMFGAIDVLEPAANEWLSSRQIRLSGLEGDWRALNPVIRIARVDLPGGRLDRVSIELDWLESLIRNRLVARHASLAGGRVLLERTSAGWRLLGAIGGTGFDPLDTLYHSDELKVTLAVGFVRDGLLPRDEELIDVDYRASNRGGIHRHRLRLSNPREGCASGCSAAFAIDVAEAIPLLRPRTAAAWSEAREFVVPAALAGASELHIGALSTEWLRRGDDSAGRLVLAFDGYRLGDDHPLDGTLTVTSRGRGDTHEARIDSGRLLAGEKEWQIPEIRLRLDRDLAQWWTGSLDLGTVGRFVTRLTPSDSIAHRWLDALALEGTARNVRGFLRLADFELGYAAAVSGIELESFKGAPWIRGGAGELFGHARGLELRLNADDLAVQFPDTFHERWSMAHLQGVLQAWFTKDYFALRGLDLRGQVDGSYVSGGFAVTRPTERYDERLSLLVHVDHSTVADAKRYIPYQLPAGLPEWLERGPRAGALRDVAFVYHGQIHTRPFELARRVEFFARIDDGQVRYHEDWPEVRDLSGEIAVAGREVRIAVERGHNAGGEDLSGSRIRLVDNAAYAEIELDARATLEQALAFVRATPLEDWMTFITPSWAGSGALELAGWMRVPLKLGVNHVGELAPEHTLAIDLEIGLDRVDLDLPDYRVALGQLVGEIDYRYPHGIRGDDVRGRLFDRPAVFDAESDSDTVLFRVSGRAPYQDVLRTLEIADPGVLEGGMDFLADLHIELGDEVSRLAVESDLTGLSVALPGALAKRSEEARSSEVEIRFLDGYQALSFAYGSANGWLDVDGSPLRGAIGFDAPPPALDPAQDELVLGGRIDGFALEQVIPDDRHGGRLLAIPVRLADLRVDAVDVGSLRFADARLNGTVESGAIRVRIDSPNLIGTAAFVGDAPLELHLERLHLPGGGGEERDPLDPALLGELIPARVVVDAFSVGDSDYGSWSFEVAPEASGVAFDAFTANMRGVEIAADRLYWQAEPNETHFEGVLRAGNLADVLPQWGYAPSVSTESATLEGAVYWSGSPAMVDLTRLVGTVDFAAADGRFSDVEAGGTGAMKIFSLINFSTIAKRLNFDFSDVVGEGVSFDALTAKADLDAGTMRFVEPLAVTGTGSNFRIAGQVNLLTQELHNEMIVTLPVSRSLPWYAAYVALANPLAGLGVLVGERVLRKPLEQFSSAKYQISGTLNDPVLKFVSVWDTRMDEPQTALEQTSGGTGVDGGVEAKPAETVPETPEPPPVPAKETQESSHTG